MSVPHNGNPPRSARRTRRMKVDWNVCWAGKSWNATLRPSGRLTWRCRVSGYRFCGTSCLPSWHWCQPSSPWQRALATLKATDVPGKTRAHTHTHKEKKHNRDCVIHNIIVYVQRVKGVCVLFYLNNMATVLGLHRKPPLNQNNNTFDDTVKQRRIMGVVLRWKSIRRGSRRNHKELML